jgi:hypothetical protein
MNLFRDSPSRVLRNCIKKPGKSKFSSAMNFCPIKNSCKFLLFTLRKNIQEKKKVLQNVIKKQKNNFLRKKSPISTPRSVEQIFNFE